MNPILPDRPFDSKIFAWSITDPISDNQGLFIKSIYGGMPRADKATIFNKLLKTKFLCITFNLKSNPLYPPRVVIGTRNNIWISNDPGEIERKLKRLAKTPAGNTATTTSRSTKDPGIIPVYDIMREDWISFDVDYVTQIRGVISEELDREMKRRELDEISF